jgi:hypothetical protein
MEVQEVLEALNHELFAVSGGSVRIKKPKAKTIAGWFPSVEYVEPNGKPMKMDGWKLTIKNKPHGPKEPIDHNKRTVIELEYSKIDVVLLSKMKSAKHPRIVVNELSPGVTFMFAHLRLSPALDLSKPIESQGAAIDQIHENTLELINWWMGIR